MKHFYIDKYSEHGEKTHVYTCPVCDKDNRGTPIQETISIVSFTVSKQQIIVLYCKACFKSEAPEEVAKVLDPDASIKEDLDLFKENWDNYWNPDERTLYVKGRTKG